MPNNSFIKVLENVNCYTIIDTVMALVIDLLLLLNIDSW